jgi:capsular polysaccharide export protein
LSLVTDRQGIYFDPTRPSDLEEHIRASTSLRPDQYRRAEDLRARILAKGITKYNLTGASHDLPEGYKILVPGQVEDDASIRLGTDQIATNLDLLKTVRSDFPEAILIYKPHPDVEAGLRVGKMPPNEAATYADIIAQDGDTTALLSQVDALATMTSLMGFEALLRGKTVHTYGAPFYAGWGLTIDHGKIPARRGDLTSLDGLTYASLIAYPRYFDPILNLPCPPEVVLTRLEQSTLSNGGIALRTLSKLQGLFASFSPLWRK